MSLEDDLFAIEEGFWLSGKDHFAERLLRPQMGDQVGNVVLKLPDIIHVAAPRRCVTVPAQIGRHDEAAAPRRDSLGHVVKLHPMPRGTVQQDDETLRRQGIRPVSAEE